MNFQYFQRSGSQQSVEKWIKLSSCARIPNSAEVGLIEFVDISAFYHVRAERQDLRKLIEPGNIPNPKSENVLKSI